MVIDCYAQATTCVVPSFESSARSGKGTAESGKGYERTSGVWFCLVKDDVCDCVVCVCIHCITETYSASGGLCS